MSSTTAATTAEELVDSFTKVISSLNDDVNRLSDLSEIRNHLLNPSPSNDPENCDPNRGVGDSLASSTVETLKALDTTLADLEKRAELLEIVIEDEKVSCAPLIYCHFSSSDLTRIRLKSPQARRWRRTGMWR